MQPSIKEWWLGVADLYEGWATNPPKRKRKCPINNTTEMYTCEAINKLAGFGAPISDYAGWSLRELIAQYNSAYDYPAGFIDAPDRTDRRYAFCMWMAETIRDVVNGKVKLEDV